MIKLYSFILYRSILEFNLKHHSEEDKEDMILHFCMSSGLTITLLKLLLALPDN